MAPACMAETLEEVVKKVATNNPAVLTQTARKYAQESQIRESRSGYFPQVDLFASYGRDKNNNFFTRLENPRGGSLTLTKSEAKFTVTQMLFDGFAVKGEVEADTARGQSYNCNINAKLEEVILQVTAAYIDTIMLRSIYIHAKENLINHQNMVDSLAKDEIKGIHGGDLGLAKSRLSLSQTYLLDLQRAIRDSQADYMRVVGSKPGTLFRPDSPDRKIPNSEDAAVAVALHNNPLVHVADAEIRAARADKRAAKANYFPKLDLEISGSNNKNVDGYNQHTNSLSAMLQMKYNIFRGGKDVAKENKSAWAIEEKKGLLNENKRLVEQNMRHAWSGYVNYKGQLMYLKDRVDNMQKTRETYSKAFINGERPILDVLDADDELYRAKAAYVVAQYKELLSRFMILEGMGKLREYFNVRAPSSASAKPLNWMEGY
jgi:adhesin transport system outer membrane protein